MLDQVKFGWVILCLCFKLTASSQTFSGHPIGLHWKKIKAKEVNILFPSGMEKNAEKVYSRIRGFYAEDSTLSSNRFKLNLVLQNQTVISNGYVGIGPFLSEFYLTTPHDPYVLGPIDWTDALAIHEYRHALQAMSSRRGVNKLLYHVLGEEAWGASFGFVVPNWFLEGDAVYSETKYSVGGRGRMPSFVREYRALHQDHLKWSYTKARNGSLKDLVPNHYVYGYAMTKYINQHFGNYEWGKILKDAVTYKGLFFPFRNALVRHAGLTPSKLYDLAIAELKSNPEDAELKDEVLVENLKKNTIRDYLSPYRLANGSLLYLETAFDRLNALYIQSKDQKTHRLTRLGITTDQDYGFVEPVVAWNEISPDARWANRNYSDIVVYNLITKQKKKITQHQKLFNPTPSNDASKLVCVEYLPEGSSAIIVLDTTGVRLHSIPMEAGKISNFPIFELGDTSLLSFVRGVGTTHLERYFLSGRPSQMVLPPVQAIMTNLAISNDTIYFSSDISSRDNLYAVVPPSNLVFQLTDHSVGIQQFSVRGPELIYTIQTANGIQIRRKPLNNCLFERVHYFEDTNRVVIDQKTESRTNLNSYEIKKASPFANPFKVYSWTVRPDEGGNVFRILGRNVLNTLQGSVAYAFDQNEKAHTISGSFEVGTMYPVLTGLFSNTYGRHIPRRSDPTKDSIRWNEAGIRIGASIPLKYYFGNTVLRFQPLVQFGTYTPTYSLGDRKNFQTTSYVRTGFSFSNQLVQAKQHVHSRFSQQISLVWNRSVNHSATSIDLNSAFTVPGITTNHVLELQFDLHRQALSDPYRFSNRTSFISGYETVTSDRSIWLRAAYHLPLFYPDAGINGLYFLQRIRGRLFSEFMHHTLTRTPKALTISYRSIGTELLLDGKLFNVLPLSFGIRCAQPLDRDLIRNNRKPVVEFILVQLF